MIFVRYWDEKIIAQWPSIEDPNAIISIYPKSTVHLTDHGLDALVQHICMSRIDTIDRDAILYPALAWIDKEDMPNPIDVAAGRWVQLWRMQTGEV